MEERAEEGRKEGWQLGELREGGQVKSVEKRKGQVRRRNSGLRAQSSPYQQRNWTGDEQRLITSYFHNPNLDDCFFPHQIPLFVASLVSLLVEKTPSILCIPAHTPPTPSPAETFHPKRFHMATKSELSIEYHQFLCHLSKQCNF